MLRTVHTHALMRAAEILGGMEALRQFLAVPMSTLTFWIQGYGRPPDAVFLRVVDLLAEQHLTELRGEGTRTAEPG